MSLRLGKNRCFDRPILVKLGYGSAVCPLLDSALPRLGLCCLGGGRLRPLVHDRQSFRDQF